MVAPFTASSARPRPVRRPARAVAVLAVAGLALTGCGDDEQGPIPASGERETTTSTAAPTTTVPPTTTTTTASEATTTSTSTSTSTTAVPAAPTTTAAP